MEPDTVVILKAAPPWLADLPEEDQAAILAAVGTPLTYTGRDAWGQLELEFQDQHGVIHTIWVDPSLVE